MPIGTQRHVVTQAHYSITLSSDWRQRDKMAFTLMQKARDSLTALNVHYMYYELLCVKLFAVVS